MVDILKKQWFVVLIAIIFIGFTVFIIYDTNKGKLPGKSVDGKDVIATIGDTNITADDLYEQMYEKQGGQSLVFLRYQAAVIDAEIETTDEIEENAKQVQEYFLSNIQNQASNSGMTVDALTKSQLAQYGFKEDELEAFCILQAKIEKMGKNYTEKHLDELFTKMQKENNGRIVSHILVKMKDANNPTKEEMKTVRAIEKDLKTMSFAEVAKKYKDKGDTVSAENGGYLGYMDKTTSFVDSFKKAALKLKKGEVSGWVKEKNANYSGWHMIKVEETDKDAMLKDEKAKKSIFDTIYSDPNTITNAFKELAKQSDVSYGNDDIKKDIESFLKSK